MKKLEQLLRPNIFNLKPYSSARDEYTGEEGVFLDANENPFNQPYNRYPDPHQRKLKAVIAKLKRINREQIFLGNGSDEAIDLIFRAFCEPGSDNVVSIDPTYGMYQVAAEINNIKLNKVPLLPDFSLDTEAILHAIDINTKLIWLCSPNNPSGNCFKRKDLEKLLEEFDGLVVLDEAYIEFARGKSMLPFLEQHPNLIILQTFSKAWGMAGLRLGMAFASPEIVKVLTAIKYPYNLNILTQNKAIELISENSAKIDQWIELLIREREALSEKLKAFNFVKHIYPSEANFLLVKTDDPKGIYNHLVNQKIIIRDRSNVTLCEGCLRITVGSPDENSKLIEALKLR